MFKMFKVFKMFKMFKINPRGVWEYEAAGGGTPLFQLKKNRVNKKEKFIKKLFRFKENTPTSLTFEVLIILHLRNIYIWKIFLQNYVLIKGPGL